MSSSRADAGPSKIPAGPPVIQPRYGSSIIINPCQRLNPVLDCIRNVSKEFGDIVPDFQLGRMTCALFLSLKYHRLHPEYIFTRIQKLGGMYNLRILLLLCDVSEHQEPIRELTKLCIINNITIIVCWSNDEAGTYLATYKAFEYKSPDLIKERVDKEHSAILRSALTSINKVNKMDVETLRTTYGSFAKIARASPEELRGLPGFGDVKVRRILDAFEKPFRNKVTSAPLPTQLRMQEDEVLNEPEAIVHSESRLFRNTQKAHESRPPQHREPVAGVSGTLSRRSTPPNPAPRPRKPSPTWDIELDLNESDFDKGDFHSAPLLDPRLAKKDLKGMSNKARTIAMQPDFRKDDQATVSRVSEQSDRPPRPPSPVWDIEMDLNEDDV